MCNILKMADYKAKRLKTWNSWAYMYILCRALFMSDSLSLVWGHSVHCAKFRMLRSSKGHGANTFHPISAKL